MTAPIVGVIGGGQLARMLIPAAVALGIELRVLAESTDSSADLAATAVGDYRDPDVVLAFAEVVDVITFDHEHVPLTILGALESAGTVVHPGSQALALAQNKLRLRERMAELGLPQPAWAQVSSAAELTGFIERHGGHAVVKTPVGGYDGKGVRVVSDASEVADWLGETELARQGGSLLVEEKVNFTRELAQVSARRPSGDFAAWPLVETRQAKGVCNEVLAPAPPRVAGEQQQAAQLAERIAEGVGVTGVLAVELFQTSDGQLLINELAMRPHNSGHFSIDASHTSQFEQHLRAVLDLPLGTTDMTVSAAVMVNLFGVDEENDFFANYQRAMQLQPGCKIHNYGKAPRVGRKMGHVTATAGDVEAALAQARAAAATLISRN